MIWWIIYIAITLGVTIWIQYPIWKHKSNASGIWESNITVFFMMFFILIPVLIIFIVYWSIVLFKKLKF